MKGLHVPLPYLANVSVSPLYKRPMNGNQKIAAALGLSVVQVGLVLHAPASPRASTPVPGADLWREERPSPLSEFVDDPYPTPGDLAVEALSAEAALLAILRAPSQPCLPASGWCSPPATDSANGGPRRYKASPTGSASRAKGCASCSPALR
jgi:hypothetical protein